MKYIKKYEDISDELIHSENFVVAYRPYRPSDSKSDKIIIDYEEYVLDVGKVESVGFGTTTDNKMWYRVKFSNGTIYIRRPKHIVFASARKKDAIDHLKMLKTAKKYNL